MFTAPRPAPTSTAFADHTERVVRRLRDALAEVIAGVPGFTYRRPNDLAAEFGLDAKLAWNVGRCLEGTDPFASARFVPGPTGMRTFLRAAQRRAAPAAAVAAAEAAFDAFRELVHTHAGTRKSFNTLAAGLARTDCVRSAVEHRRLTFEGNSYVWGVQARTIFRTNIVIPSADPRLWDLVTIRGYIDFRRMRPGVAWRISQPFSVDSTHSIHTEVPRSALDADHTNGEVPLLREFCTQPLPRFRPVLGAHGQSEFEFVETSVGKTASITCITGELLRCVEPRFRDALYVDFSATFPVRTPAEVLVFDLLIHRELFQTTAGPQVALYSDLFGGGPSIRYEPSDRLPMHEPLEHLGRGAPPLTPDVPRYAEMLRYALARTGCPPDDFGLYRLRMQYPPLSTTLMISQPLPDAPAL